MTADLHHLAAAYALDALDDVERREFERHYPTCEICASEVEDFRSVAASMAESTATKAPSGLKNSVMAEIAQTRQLSPRVAAATAPNRRISGRVMLAAAAALVLLAGVFAVTLPDKETSVTEVVESADAVVTTLAPSALSEDGYVQIVWSKDRDQVAVIGSSLSDPGDGKAYALWFLLDDGVAPAGLFLPTNGSVSAVLDVDDLDANGWGITIEPDTGSEQPTTDVIFVDAA